MTNFELNNFWTAKTQDHTACAQKIVKKMKSSCDEIIIIPSNSTAHIQEIHILIGHMLCGALEQKLGLSS